MTSPTSGELETGCLVKLKFGKFLVVSFTIPNGAERDDAGE